VQAALAQIRYQSKPRMLQVALAEMKNWVNIRLSSHHDGALKCPCQAIGIPRDAADIWNISTRLPSTSSS